MENGSVGGWEEDLADGVYSQRAAIWYEVLLLKRRKKNLNRLKCEGLGQIIPAGTCWNHVGQKSQPRRRSEHGPWSDPGKEWAEREFLEEVS